MGGQKAAGSRANCRMAHHPDRIKLTRHRISNPPIVGSNPGSTQLGTPPWQMIRQLLFNPETLHVGTN